MVVNVGVCTLYCQSHPRRQVSSDNYNSRRDRSGADSVTSFWCRVWFGNIAWNWKVVFTTFFWLVRTLLQQNQTRLQKLSHNFLSRVWCCCAASVSTCAHCACLWIPETTAVDILSTHGAWWTLVHISHFNKSETLSRFLLFSSTCCIMYLWSHFTFLIDLTNFD